MMPTNMSVEKRHEAHDAAFDASGFSPPLLHAIFERQAALRPWAPALVLGDREQSYATVDQEANQLAHHLKRSGVGPGDRVALLLPRSMHRYIALLGALKAGAAYVPLDPEYPADRIRFILEDCEAAAIITIDALADLGAGHDCPIVLLDHDAATIQGESTEPISWRDATHRPPAGDDLGYIIYTSGTTGRPKGVAVEHRSVCHFVAAERAVFAVRPDDRVYQGFSIAFDASVEEVWLAFAAGAALVVGDDDMAHAGPGLANLLTAAGVTVFSCVPTLLALLEDDLPTVRLLILGGEACPPALVARWRRAGRRMVNTYGPTEATVVATYADCELDRPVTIGRPLPGYTVALLDEQLRPVAPGEVGELHIGGPAVARGYVNRPELTAEKFIFLPASGSLGPAMPSDEDGRERYYKSGDLGRFNAEGDIEFLGRADSQIKIRGYRVELAEIEAALLECRDVLAAAVTTHGAAAGIEQLVAYIVPRGGEPLDGVALRATLSDRLPRFMIPAHFEFIAGLPTLPSGKVDRRSLPAPRSATGADQIEPGAERHGRSCVAGLARGVRAGASRARR